MTARRTVTARRAPQPPSSSRATVTGPASNVTLLATASAGGDRQADLLGQRVGRDRRQVRRQRTGGFWRPIQEQADAGVQRQLGLLAQVLHGARQLPGVPLCSQLRRQLGVDDHDDALVVGDRRAGPWGGQDLHLVGAQSQAGELHAAVVVVGDLVVAGGRHDGRDGFAVAPADDRQQRLDAAVHELRLVADDLHGLDVQLVRQERLQLVGGARRQAGAQPATGHRQPEPAQRLTHAHAGPAAQGPAQLHGSAQVGHGGLQGQVTQGRQVRLRPAREMHGLGRATLCRRHEDLVELLGQEGQQRCHRARHAHECQVERPEGGRLVRGVPGAREAAPAAPQPPRGKVVHEEADRPRRGARVVLGQRGTRLLGHARRP